MDRVGIHFSAATTAAIPQLLQFNRELNEYDGTPFDEERTRAALEKLLVDTTLGEVWLICRSEEEEPIGYMALTWGFSIEFGGRDAFLDELYIHSSGRGQGIGKQAMEFAVERCRANSINALHLEVERENQNARAFYLKTGFEDRSHYFLMSKRLS